MRARSLLLAGLLTLAPATARAQHAAAANTASNIAVYTAIGLDAIHAARDKDKSAAFTCQAIRLGATVVTAELLKRWVHKERPDHSDFRSFPSMHSGSAWASAGWRWQIGLPLAVTTGGLRIAARKHDIVDVLAGAGIGYMSHFLGPCDGR